MHSSTSLQSFLLYTWNVTCPCILQLYDYAKMNGPSETFLDETDSWQKAWSKQHVGALLQNHTFPMLLHYCTAMTQGWQIDVGLAFDLERKAFMQIGIQLTMSSYLLAQPRALLFPRDPVMIDARFDTKTLMYNFMGDVYGTRYDAASIVAVSTQGNLADLYYIQRVKAVKFAREHFQSDSYFAATDAAQTHSRLGIWDHSQDHRISHARYLGIIAQSRFTLCPEGDQPWTLRFFEAVSLKSIPVVWHPTRWARNPIELELGYQFVLFNESHVYDVQVAESNFKIFTQHQLLRNVGANRT